MVNGNLPDGWVWVPIEQLADGSKYALKAGPFGSSLKKEFYVPKGYKIYGQEQVIRGDASFGDYYIDEERFQLLKSNAVKPGDILISLVGTIGKVLILPENIEPGIINPRLVKLSLDANRINAKYFKYYFATKSAREYFSTVSHGQTMEVLNLGILKKLPVPLPPLSQQERIVAKIEELFTQLDAGINALSRVQAGLRRYKASVLKAAVEGKLLEDGKVENGELPDGWEWVKWGELVSFSQNGFGKRRSDNGTPTIVLRLADIVDKDISLENIRRIGATKEEIKKYELLKDDMICIRVNGSLDNVGRMVLFRNANEAITFCDHFIRFRLKEPEMASFFSMYFDTDRARKFVELNRVSSAGQNTISQGTLLEFEVPLPPLEEQRRIVAEVERRLSVAREVESVVEKALVRAGRLRQAVLRSAFEGRL